MSDSEQHFSFIVPVVEERPVQIQSITVPVATPAGACCVNVEIVKGCTTLSVNLARVDKSHIAESLQAVTRDPITTWKNTRKCSRDSSIIIVVPGEHPDIAQHLANLRI